VPPRPAHYDFRTPEYTSFPETRSDKWETTRGLTPSFGFNRFDREEDHEAPTALIQSFIDSVAKNGNLLLNVGPRGEDAAIPDAQRTRLEALGDWLARNGEAIYGTRPWRRAEGATAEGLPVRFTEKRGVVYAIVLGRPAGSQLTLTGAELLPPRLRVQRLADGAEIRSRREGERLHLDCETPGSDPAAQAFALRPR
jgi:alpha-L-fucosidase